MQSVLISIRPQYCELIASGKKTIEVRKTRPKLETPFKCYIYCTKDKENTLFKDWIDPPFVTKEYNIMRCQLAIWPIISGSRWTSRWGERWLHEI